MYVEMKNIFKQYGNFRASDNVNFGIEKGKLVALLGPSGSGKTTILRMIAGLETPSFGDIYIDGKRVNDVPANQREIGFVFQNYALFRHMTVYDNIAFGLKLKKVPKDEIKKRVTELRNSGSRSRNCSNTTTKPPYLLCVPARWSTCARRASAVKTAS